MVPYINLLTYLINNTYGNSDEVGGIHGHVNLSQYFLVGIIEVFQRPASSFQPATESSHTLIFTHIAASSAAINAATN